MSLKPDFSIGKYVNSLLINWMLEHEAAVRGELEESGIMMGGTFFLGDLVNKYLIIYFL